MTRMLNAVVGRCVSASAKTHVVLGLVATVAAALAIVPNGLGSDAIEVDKGWRVGMAVPSDPGFAGPQLHPMRISGETIVSAQLLR
jgi:hypothetical protein